MSYTSTKISAIKRYPVVSLVLFACLLVFQSCAPSKRSYYSRTEGRYVSYSTGSSSSQKAKRQKVRKTGSCRSSLTPVAESFLGVPYLWAGETKKGMDCSGFVKTVFQEACTYSMPHKASIMATYGKSVSKSRLRHGDLVFFGNALGIKHVGIYIRDGKFIHASVSKGVRYSSLEEPYYKKRYKKARRVI